MLAIFLDIETTGLDLTRHRVIDIGYKVIDISSKKLKATYQSVVKQPEVVWRNKDPMSIQINGYTWEQVSQGKDPLTVAQDTIQIFRSLGVERGRAVFICQNPGFDRGFFSQLIDVYTQEKLNWPYHWLDLASMYWVVFGQKIAGQQSSFPDKMNLSKNEIAREYQIPAEPDPHRAINGVNHLIQCYQAVLNDKFEF